MDRQTDIQMNTDPDEPPDISDDDLIALINTHLAALTVPDRSGLIALRLWHPLKSMVRSIWYLAHDRTSEQHAVVGRCWSDLKKTTLKVIGKKSRK